MSARGPGRGTLGWMSGRASEERPSPDTGVVGSARRKTPLGLAITVAGRYRRGACIAQGGSSSVHRATVLATNAEVALKSYHLHRAFDPALVPSLEAGRVFASRVGADAMVPVLDVGTDDDGTPFVVMPLLEGETFGSILDRSGALPVLEAISLARRALVSIDVMHAAGMTHGDPSPDNLFVRRDGRVLLLDHEGLGEVGAARAARTTEGYGRSGGVRELRDDHRALAAIAAMLAGRAGPPPPDEAIDDFLRALREGHDEAAARALGLTAVRRRWRWLMGALFVSSLAALAGRGLGLY